MNLSETGHSGNRFIEEFNKTEVNNFHASHNGVNSEIRSYPMSKSPSVQSATIKRPFGQPKTNAPITTNKFKKNDAKQNFTYMPMPSTSTNRAISASVESASTKCVEPQQDPVLQKPGRNLKIITGRVDFVVKMHKLYPMISALFEVYGKILKISPGKFKAEHILLIRNSSGPVLQAELYNYDIQSLHLSNGCDISSIGRFKSEGRFHIFKITKIVEQPTEDVLARIQNICSFALHNK